MDLHQPHRGFTLVEMLVSLALFTIVATMAVGTLLILINGNSRVVSEQTALTSLSFLLDSMTREIRTGSDYYCGTRSQVTDTSITSSTTAIRNCTGGMGISFREAGESLTGGSSARRIAYYFEGGTLRRQIGNNTAEVLVANDVTITNARFIVTGAATLTGGNDIIQPTVTVLIEGRASTTDATNKTFTLQTTVTQRALDL